MAMVNGFTLFFWDAIVARFFSVERCIASRVITDLEADPSDFFLFLRNWAKY